MKKLLAIALAVIMVLSMAACGAQSNEKEPKNNVDLSKYPADLKDWTAADYNNYFIAAGVYSEELGYVQDHATYYDGTPIYEASGAMDDVGDYNVLIFTFDPKSEDEEVATWMETIRSTKAFPTEVSDDMSAVAGFPMDHMVANAVFSFQYSQSDAVYEAAEKAFQDLMTAMNVTPDF